MNQELAMKLLVRLSTESEGRESAEGQEQEEEVSEEPGRAVTQIEQARASRASASRAGASPGAEEAARERGSRGQLEILTPRELEVLRLLSEGQTNPQIAQNLLVSRGTVKIHVQHIISKLGVSDRTQASVRAIEAGLLGTGTQS